MKVGDRVVVTALLALSVGCAPPSPGEHRGGGSPRGSSAASRADPSAHPSPIGSTAVLRPPSSDLGEPDPVARALLEARIVELAPAPGGATRSGVFEATLEGNPQATSSSGRRTATLTLALDSAPLFYRRPLAFYRLADALGLHVVPAAVLRPVSVGELGALLEAQPAARAVISAQARVQNDGTVDALLVAPAKAELGAPWTRPRAIPLDAASSFEVRTWERWAGSPAPVPGERPQVLRDFVEALVLDYLAASVVRRALLFLPDADALVLDDNHDAFPPHEDVKTLDRILRRLRAVSRFPRGLHASLVRFDRARAAAVLAPAGFETWLVSPRGLVELDERRAGLLSLLEAQIAERGEGAVLCL